MYKQLPIRLERCLSCTRTSACFRPSAPMLITVGGWILQDRLLRRWLTIQILPCTNVMGTSIAWYPSKGSGIPQASFDMRQRNLAPCLLSPVEACHSANMITSTTTSPDRLTFQADSMATLALARPQTPMEGSSDLRLLFIADGCAVC